MNEGVEFAISVGMAAYGSEARKTAGDNIKDNLYYIALGLSGEVGEVMEKLKKLIRDRDGVIDDEFRLQLSKELGDVLWYINALCDKAQISLSDVAVGNIEKLADRQVRGVLSGNGDNR